MGRISTGAKVAAALVACLTLPATAFLVVAIGNLQDARDRGGDRTGASAGALDVVAATLVVDQHLQAERAWHTIELLGAGDAIDLPQGADADSAERTDAAIDALRAEVEGQDAATGADYMAVLDALATLDDIRADVEANRATPAFGSLTNYDVSGEVFARYSEVGVALGGAAETALLGVIDDPDLRTSAALGLGIARQRGLLDETTSRLLLATVSGGLDTADEIAAVAAALGEWQTGDAALRAARAPYDSMVEEHLPVRVAGEVTAVVDEALSTGAVDLPTLLATVDGPYTQGLSDLEDAVAERRDRLAARAAADAGRGDEGRAWLVVGLAALTVLAPLAVAIVILLVARGGPRTPAPPGGVPPPPVSAA